MTQDELINEYFEWMCQIIYDRRYLGRDSYNKLLSYLYDTPFSYTIGMDGNRADDGMELRYRFGLDRGYDDVLIAVYLDTKPCSILEMMVALAIRCEEHIMENPDIGDRTGRWFWDMIESLGLEAMNDHRFNIRYVETVISQFLEHDYKRTGEGGLFTVPNTTRDMRTTEIWYQLCEYLRYLED